ncbi:alkylhalidase, partial [Candidatus Poribacteria bacterium]|nr:alkylhalidase [Candidatus Poribacteria bacterium]
GQDEGATLVMHTDDKSAWFWYIPLADDLVSVGVVGPIDTLLEDKRKGLQYIFDNQVEKCLPLKGRIQSAEQVFSAKATKDFSYRSSQVAGDGWVLVGDALGFLDPVYSSGVLLAFQSGEMAADCIIDAWKNNDFSEKRLSAFQDKFWRGMDAFKKLVYAFYSKDFSFARFLKKYPQCKQGVTDILSGNIFKPSVEQIFEPLDQMLS